MPQLLKPLERAGKRVLAVVVGLLLWRPWRRGLAERRLKRVRRVLLVRVDDRVGEALLLTPLFTSLKSRDPQPEVHVLVHPRTARILAGHPAVDRVIPFDRRRLWLGPFAPALRALVAQDYDVVVDCGNWSEPSVSHAILARLAGPRSAVLGPSVAPLSILRTHAVPPRRDTRKEIAQRLELLSPIEALRPSELLTFRSLSVGAEVAALLPEVEAAPHAVVNPGGRLGWRRVPNEAFTEAARTLLAEGRTPLITWGPGEEGLARSLADELPGARLAPQTTLDELAALMAAAGLTICNNTGPMHLSVAVGAPTLQLFLRMDPVRWGHDQPPHRVLDLTAWAEDPQAMAARVADEVRSFLASVRRETSERGLAG